MEASARVRGTVADHGDARRWNAIARTSTRCARPSTPPKIVDLAKQIHQSKKIVIVGVDLASRSSHFWPTACCPSASTPKRRRQQRQPLSQDPHPDQQRPGDRHQLRPLLEGHGRRAGPRAQSAASQRSASRTAKRRQSRVTRDDCVCVSIASTALRRVACRADGALQRDSSNLRAHQTRSARLRCCARAKRNIAPARAGHDESADLNRIPPPRPSAPAAPAPAAPPTGREPLFDLSDGRQAFLTLSATLRQAREIL